MKYIVREVQYQEGVQRTAGTKARNDIEDILLKEGYEVLTIEKKIDKDELKFKSISYHLECLKEWKKTLRSANVKSGDEVVVQFPSINHSLFLSGFFKTCIKKGIKISLLIHDMEMLRTAARDDTKFTKKIRINLEEKRTLDIATRVIAHNKCMINQLVKMGVSAEKLVNLEVFDYLIDDAGKEYEHTSCTKDDPVIIAGALKKHKVGYVYDLPDDVKFNLYGIGYEEQNKDNIKYWGSFPADELPFSLKGSFGLVWDGTSSTTCEGPFGEYLRINNPHKTSLYLASGIPVIIWKEAALAEFVENNNCGITVNSLYEISDRLKSMTDNEYSEIKKGAQKMAPMLKSGYYTKKIMNEW